MTLLCPRTDDVVTTFVPMTAALHWARCVNCGALRPEHVERPESFPARLPDAAQRTEQARLRHEARALAVLACEAEDRGDVVAAEGFREHAEACADRVAAIYAEALTNGPQR